MSRPSLIERLRRMNQRSLFGPGVRRMVTSSRTAGEPELEDISTAGQARAEAVQRLQVGMFGIVLLVGLASIIGGQAELNEDLAVPEAAPTTEPKPAPAQANPLADAGVVPDIAAEPSASPMPALPPAASGNVAPEQ
jgi:hypothetical protein